MTKSKETYYSILNLEENCDNQDIKNAFVELSKKYHPDKTADKKSHEKFIKVNEAYNVLSKAVSRRNYDHFLSNNKDREYHHYYEDVYTTRNDAAFSKQREQMNFESRHYYGIKGVKKVPNGVIVLMCVAFAFIGVGVEAIAIRKSLAFDREKMKHGSAVNNYLWQQARTQAEANGNVGQIEKFMDNRLTGLSTQHATEEYQRIMAEKDTTA